METNTNGTETVAGTLNADQTVTRPLAIFVTIAVVTLTVTAYLILPTDTATALSGGPLMLDGWGWAFRTAMAVMIIPVLPLLLLVNKLARPYGRAFISAEHSSDLLVALFVTISTPAGLMFGMLLSPF